MGCARRWPWLAAAFVLGAVGCRDEDDGGVTVVSGLGGSAGADSSVAGGGGGAAGADGGAAGADGGAGGCGDDACAATESCDTCPADCGCAEGQACQAGLCVVRQDCGGGCPDGQVCSEGRCVDLPDQCPCPGESYCDLATHTCRGGCVDDGDCNAGRICYADARECRDGCRADGDCGAGGLCEGLQCRAGCRADGACGAGNICEGLQCRPGCRDDGDCGGARICVDLQCRGGCRDDGHCPGEQICVERACRAGCRGDAGCGDGEICDDATLLCRDGCRGHGDCPLESMCRDTRCVAGCASDEGCRAGDLCVGNACRPGCREHARCDGEQFCDPRALDCVPFEGSGRCWRDDHCGVNQLCDLRTLECRDANGQRECGAAGVCNDCGSGETCINELCVRRREDELCGLDNVARCGKNAACAPVTLTCDRLDCEGQNVNCTQRVGLRAARGGTCNSTRSNDQQYCFCSDANGYDCREGDTCFGLRCVDGNCRARFPCQRSAECVGSAWVCVEGECAPYYEARCANDADCDAGSVYCQQEVGRCAHR